MVGEESYDFGAEEIETIMKGLRALPTTEQLLKAINSPDDLAMVIRAHQCIEAALDNLIIESMPFRHDELIQRLQFLLKVDLAIVLHVVDIADRPALLVLNKIRNRFAHDLVESVTKDDVCELFNALSKRAATSMGDPEDEASIQERFRLACATLFVCLEVSLQRVRDGKLWDKAMHEIVVETIGPHDEKADSPSMIRIRERFSRLKQEEKTKS